MAQNNIGGFFVDVAANVNAQSFQKAEKSIQGVQSSISKLLGFAKTAAPIIMATTAGAVETANLKVAKAIGLSASKLDQWKTAASVAGVSAGALTSSMSQLESKMQKLKLGQVDTNLAKNLGFLGIQYGDFANMNADQRMRSVFSKANGMQDQKLAAQLVADTLGSGAREYYDYLKLSGKSLDQQLQEAKSLNFTTDQTKKNAMLFNAEAKAIGGAFKSISTLIGSEIAKQLTPVAQRLKEIIEANHDLIATGITGFIEKTGQVIRAIGSSFEKINPLVKNIVANFGGLDKVLVKVGVGFTALKLSQVAGNLTHLITGINLLKGGLTGLVSGIAKGGLFLVMEDLMYYFMGGGSVFGDIINNLDDLKSKLGIGDWSGQIAESFNNIKDATINLIKAFGNADTVGQALKNIGQAVVSFAFDETKALIQVINGLVEAVTGLINLDWSKAGTGFTNMAVGIGKAAENVGIAAAATFSGESYEDVKSRRENLDALRIELANTNNPQWINQDFSKFTDKAKSLIKAIGYDNLPWDLQAKIKKDTIKDGIISPGGHVTQVAPDDWVLAARNLDDMASAFIPHGITNNSSVSAPAEYTVNQNITINGGKDSAQTVKQQAYAGAYKALNETINKGNMRLQQMPGLR